MIKNAVAEGYEVQLTDQEVYGDGPFAPMHDWLDQQIATNKAYGFFRPYQQGAGGIAPERWHLSYAPLSRDYQSLLDIDTLAAILSEQPLALKEVVLEYLPKIFQQYIEVDQALYP